MVCASLLPACLSLNVKSLAFVAFVASTGRRGRVLVHDDQESGI